jgi:hypothetical protein
MSNETKVRRCWDCDYFVQATEEDNTGKCVRHAPDKADELRGETIATTIPGLEMFANITDGTVDSCGEFKRATITIPAPPV